MNCAKVNHVIFNIKQISLPDKRNNHVILETIRWSHCATSSTILPYTYRQEYTAYSFINVMCIRVFLHKYWVSTHTGINFAREVVYVVIATTACIQYIWSEGNNVVDRSQIHTCYSPLLGVGRIFLTLPCVGTFSLFLHFTRKITACKSTTVFLRNRFPPHDITSPNILYFFVTCTLGAPS